MFAWGAFLLVPINDLVVPIYDLLVELCPYDLVVGSSVEHKLAASRICAEPTHTSLAEQMS